MASLMLYIYRLFALLREVRPLAADLLILFLRRLAHLYMKLPACSKKESVEIV